MEKTFPKFLNIDREDGICDYRLLCVYWAGRKDLHKSSFVFRCMINLLRLLFYDPDIATRRR